ncbi:notO [Symbiodinium sp. CCMP2456]|nr:notO [Symbiodinium sp. CCMP2456]
MATRRFGYRHLAGGVGGAGILALYAWRRSASRLAHAKALSQEVSLQGRSALVIGGTSGVGHGLAKRLALSGCSVTVVGRSQERGAAIVEELQKTASQQGATSDGSVYTFGALDAFSMPACRALADDLLKSETPLDYLVLTQGMATLQGYTPTAPEKGGLDEKLTLHYYSRALLMDALAPLLQKSSDGRCLSVLSGGIHSAYAGYAEDPDLRKSYSLTKAANLAGFYNDIAVDALSNAYPGVSFVHAAPGFVATSWGTEMPTFVKALVRLLQNLGRSKEDAAEYMFRSLYHDDFKGGGFYIVNQYGESTETLTSLHKEAKDTVWSHTKAILAKF